MENNYLRYLSIVQVYFERNASSYESELEEWDDGESHPMKEAKEHTLQLIERDIENLQQLQKDIKTKSLLQLEKEY